MRKVTFEATVRKHKKYKNTTLGRIVSKKLGGLVGKRVKVTVRVVKKFT